MQDTKPAPEETLATHVARAIDELGHSADAIADRFRTLGIKGVRKSEHACPVACYLADIDHNWLVDVLETEVRIQFWDDTTDNITKIWVELTDSASAFVTRFDQGIYLDLVAQPAVTR